MVTQLQRVGYPHLRDLQKGRLPRTLSSQLMWWRNFRVPSAFSTLFLGYADSHQVSTRRSIRLITCLIFGRGSFWHSINAPELLSIVFIGGCYNSTSFYTNLLSPFVNIFQRVVLFVDVLRIEVHLCSRGFLHISGLSRF